MSEHKITCPLREAMCGLTPQVSGGRVDGVRPNADDVWSRGHICQKREAIGHIHADPDRLRRPLVWGREGRHVEVSWDDESAEAERVLRPVLDSDGARALTVCAGNPAAHKSDLSAYIGALMGFAQAALMTGRDRCTLLIYPADASYRGDRWCISRGEHHRRLTVIVDVSERGHARRDGSAAWLGPRLGRNPAENRRPSSGRQQQHAHPTDVIDVPSNTHVLNGAPCKVRPV